MILGYLAKCGVVSDKLFVVYMYLIYMYMYYYND